MCYNTLIYPDGSIPGRADTLKKIFDFEKPDLLLLQELKSSAGLEQILDVLNSFPNANYSSGTYVPQISNPSNNWRLQQNIIYNEDIFQLAQEDVITTIYRDINYFKFYLFDSQLDDEADSTFVHVYNTHLKSSQGADNELLRAQMAEVMMEHINALPLNSYVIAGGDFNLYYSSEDAYQILTETGTDNPMLDPIDLPGDWTESSFPNKEILTQSTRANDIGDGSGGGMDDRFDFILLSEALMNASSDVHFLNDSYKALGNNGTCFNGSITGCVNNNDVPLSVLRALFYMSDHLPVVLKLGSSIILNQEEINENTVSIFPNPAQDYLKVVGFESREFEYKIFSSTGQLVLSDRGIGFVDISGVPNGIYFLRLSNDSNTSAQFSFVKTNF